jgi:hypothetical protein
MQLANGEIQVGVVAESSLYQLAKLVAPTGRLLCPCLLPDLAVS